MSGHAACKAASCPEHQQRGRQVSVHAAHQPATTKEIQCDASAAAPLQLLLLLCMGSLSIAKACLCALQVRLSPW